LNFPQICDMILRSSATRLQINRRVFKMGRKSKELSEDRKQLVVDLKREGHRHCEIVKLLRISESTIRSIWKKYNTTGNVENISRVGRPRKVTRRGEVRLLRTVKKESWQGFKRNYQ
jgi:transposase